MLYDGGKLAVQVRAEPVGRLEGMQQLLCCRVSQSAAVNFLCEELLAPKQR